MRPDQDVFLETLFREHFYEFEIYAYALLLDRGDAQVAVQDAFHVACLKIDDVMNSPNPTGWMKVTIKNIARNMKKRKTRELQLIISMDAFPFEIADVTGNDGTELLEHCKTLISDEEFALMKGIVLEGFSYQEMAERSEISMWNCYKRVQRALLKLRRGLVK